MLRPERLEGELHLTVCVALGSDRLREQEMRRNGSASVGPM